MGSSLMAAAEMVSSGRGAVMGEMGFSERAAMLEMENDTNGRIHVFWAIGRVVEVELPRGEERRVSSAEKRPSQQTTPARPHTETLLDSS